MSEPGDPRVINFGSGPATLPLTVIERVRRDLRSLPGIGISPLEISHRSPWFAGVLEDAEESIRALLAVPPTHRVIFCQGGATQQFSMVPMNLVRAASDPSSSRASADYVVTGTWGAKAAREAEKHGGARVAWTDGPAGYRRVPAGKAWTPSPDAAYVHITTNETIEGVQWPMLPSVPTDVPLVTDMSSDFLSRPVDVGPIGLLYAGAQKNAGTAGVTVVIVDERILARVPDDLPTMLDYRTFTEHGSRYNTPPVFAIYVTMLVTRWLRDDVGGLAEQDRRNRAKASVLYEAIDASDGFYRGHAERASRSLMNVTFRSPSAELDDRFVAEAASRGLAGLRGHRSLGGMRASIYNAITLEAAKSLATFMAGFAGGVE